MSSTSNTSSSGSSAAANTVVVTARDIEFSNYNSSTGKWDNAVLTMMIEDANTPDNINLEVYDERVYAVFRNHDDLTDTIQTSAEVDGMDFRVTISMPMVASGKYELYKVYGETSGNEYATSSQFYIQVPGRVWDFTNDVVEEDTELVSDWFNYGEVITSDNITHGFPTREDAMKAAAGNVGADITVNGETINTDDIVSYKLTSMFTGEVTKLSGQSSARFLSGYNSLRNLDIVSSGLTAVKDSSTSYSEYGLWSTGYNQKFGFPNTIVAVEGWLRNAHNIYNKPIYIPDSVTRVGTMLYTDARNYTAKIRFSPNISYMNRYNFSINNYAWPLYPLSNNVQLNLYSHPFVFDIGAGYNQKFDIPSVWTHIPQYFFYNFTSYDHDIEFPEGITSIGNSAYSNLGLGKNGTIKTITFPSTLRSIGSGSITFGSSTNAKIDLSKCNSLTSVNSSFSGNGFRLHEFEWPTARPVGFTTLPGNLFRLALNYLPVDENNVVNFEIPEGVTTIGTSCFTFNSNGMFSGRTDIDVNTVFKIDFPSTVTSIGADFGSQLITGWREQGKKVTLDFTKLDPDNVTIDDQWNEERGMGTFMQSEQHSGDIRNEYELKILIASGTQEKWEAKLPDYYIVNPSWLSWNTTFYRHIEWVEPTTEYGKLVYYPNYTTTWGVSASVGTEPNQGAEIHDVEEFEDWISTLSPAPYISATGDLRFDSPNGEDLQYTDVNGDTQTIQYGVWEIRGASLNFDFSASERYVVFNNNITISTVDQTSTAEVELTSMAQYNSLCMSGMPYAGNSSPVLDKTTRITVGADSTVIPIACIKSYDFGTIPTTIPNYFLVASSVESVNMRHANITTIGDGFLCDCGYFNSNVDLTGVTSVGTNFLSKCESFNGTLGDMSSLTAIGTRFLYDCRSFDHPIQLPSAITSLDAFMSSCYAFNQPLDFSHITTIGNSVLHGCKAFNYPLDLSNVTSVGNYFLASCNVYNQPVTIANVTTVGESFLRGCSVFNSQVSLPNCTTFGMSFMQYCTIFNQPLDMTNITNCGSGFLQQCKAFNQPLDLSNLTDAGTSNDYGGFLNYCDAFNQPLNLPKIRCFGGLSHMSSFNSDVTFGPDLAKLSMWSFGYNDKMCKTYNFGTVNPTNVKINNSYYNSLFVATNSSTDAYVNGVKIAGTYRSAWMSKCPNNSSGTFTRKLVNAGY